MQNAKDSFYLALRERLAAINPARTVVVNGATRPAVIVAENESPTAAPPQLNAFYLRWGAARVVQGAERARRPLMALECAISYAAAGASDAATDRGRTLAALDLELLQMCTPPRTQKCDYTWSPPAMLGTMVFWGVPEFGEPEPVGELLRRAARLTIFFFPEMEVA
jgi:hypothetical protein